MTSVDRSSVSLVKSQLSDYKAINKSYARQNDSTLISNKNASRELIKSGINLLDPELSSIVIKSSSKLKDRLQIPDGTGRYIPSDYIDESSNLNASFPVRSRRSVINTETKNRRVFENNLDRIRLNMILKFK